MDFFFVRKIIEFDLFQASELELIDRIAILTRIFHVEAVKTCNISEFSCFAWEMRVNIAILSSSSSSEDEIDQIRLFFERKKNSIQYTYF